jgi:hypothetical protein
MQLWTFGRPNPKVNIGPVDCSVPMVVCDLLLPNRPLVYISDAFTYLTGYTKAEVMGRSCRFMQTPGGASGKITSESGRKHAGPDRETVKKLDKAISRNSEVQMKITNFKKDGTRFTNFLTIIPVKWKSDKYTHSLGLLCDYGG